MLVFKDDYIYSNLNSKNRLYILMFLTTSFAVTSNMGNFILYKLNLIKKYIYNSSRRRSL